MGRGDGSAFGPMLSNPVSSLPVSFLSLKKKKRKAKASGSHTSRKGGGGLQGKDCGVEGTGSVTSQADFMAR